MPLGDHYPNSVVFVCDDRGEGPEPVGTAFLVAMPNDYGGHWQYSVTARHVVGHQRPTSLRVRRRDGGDPVDIPVPEWVPHPTADVAVAPADLDSSILQVAFTLTSSFADVWHERSSVPIQPGDQAYFIGLLSDLRSMTDRTIPMVRSGRLGALYQADIPVREGQHFRIEPCAHLVDAHSRAGFSGSPCIFEQLTVNVPRATVFPYLALLGVVVGHFDSYAGVMLKDGEKDHETDMRVRDNQGVAVVVPIEAVREVLEMEVLVEDRKQREARAKAERERGDSENAATLDVVGGPSEFERFEDLASKLIEVPKTELDEKRKEG